MSAYQKTYPKLDKHPDSDEVKNLIANGESPNEIAKMLTRRYPEDSRLWISHSYMYLYRKDKHPELAGAKRRGQYAYRSAKRKGIVQTVNLPDVDIGTRIMELTGQEPKPPEPRMWIPDEQLISWMSGVDGFVQFVEDMIIERGEHVKLQNYQVEMAEKFLKYDRVGIVAGGQVGKDFMMQNFIIWWAVTHAGSTQMIVCSAQAQTDALKSRIEDKLAFSGELNYTYAGSKAKPVALISLKNGAQMFFFTAKAQIAGYTNVDLIWLNEARFIRDDEVARVSPLLGIGGGKMFVLSRPLYRKGFFWEFIDRIPEAQTMKIPTEMNIYFDRKVIEADRSTMSPHLFKADYMAEFSDAGSAFFSDKAIEDCSKVDYDFKTMVPEEGWTYSIGIDPARLRDVSTMIVIGHHEKKDKYKVFHINGFNPDVGESSQSVQFSYINMLDRSFGAKYIVPENTGMGGPYTEALTEEWKRWNTMSRIEPYDTHGIVPKIDLYEWARQIVDRKKIQIPREARILIHQLKMTQFGATDSGKVRVETPVTDDYADAFCLALYAFKKPFEIGIGSARREVKRLPRVSR